MGRFIIALTTAFALFLGWIGYEAFVATGYWFLLTLPALALVSAGYSLWGLIRYWRYM